MSTSSLPTDYSTTLDLSGLGSITLSDTFSSSYSSADTITLTTTASSTCYPTYISNVCIPSSTWASGSSIGGLTTSQINIGSIFPSAEFIDCFPNWDRVEKMCEEYPGLKIAFEKFKTTYNLVKDDYDTPKDQRPKP